MSELTDRLQRRFAKPSPFVLVFPTSAWAPFSVSLAMPRDADGCLLHPRVLWAATPAAPLSIEVTVDNRLWTINRRARTWPIWKELKYRALHGGEEAQQIYKLGEQFGSAIGEEYRIKPNDLIEVRSLLPVAVVIVGLLEERFLVEPEENLAVIRRWSHQAVRPALEVCDDDNCAHDHGPSVDLWPKDLQPDSAKLRYVSLAADLVPVGGRFVSWLTAAAADECASLLNQSGENVAPGDCNPVVWYRRDIGERLFQWAVLDCHSISVEERHKLRI